MPPLIDAPDPLTTSERRQHAEQVSALWQAYAHRENTRVPITFASDDQLWTKVAGCSFGEFYREPEQHLWAQLKGRKWFIEHVISDTPPYPPEKWPVAVQLWMEENEFFGCEVVYQEDNYAWGMPLQLSKPDLLRRLADIDAEQRVRTSRAYHLYQELNALAGGLQFEGCAVQVAPPGQGTHGIFTKAAEVRGLEQLCLDLVEDPDFAHEYLRLFTEKQIERIRAWRKLTQPDAPALPLAAWSCPDDSLQLLSAALYEEFVLPCHQQLFSAMTNGRRGMHLCGYASQHYVNLYNHLGIRTLDGPGDFIDHSGYLRSLPELSFNAQFDHPLVTSGSPAEIQAMVRGMLTPGACIPGRFNIVGFVERDTPLENIRTCYESGVAAGQINQPAEED